MCIAHGQKCVFLSIIDFEPVKQKSYVFCYQIQQVHFYYKRNASIVCKFKAMNGQKYKTKALQETTDINFLAL